MLSILHQMLESGCESKSLQFWALHQQGHRVARILVVDDSGFQRKMICKILKRGGHDTYQAKNGREALELLRTTETPDCVLTDLSMPDMTGLDLLSGIGDMKLTVPVIVITADIQISTQKECYDRGALAVINKPLNDEKLKEVVGKAIG